MGRIFVRPIGSCPDCYCWGELHGTRCVACYFFSRSHPAGSCRACDRQASLKNGFCRLCWIEVRALVPHSDDRAHREQVMLTIRTHQLFFANTFTALALRTSAKDRERAAAAAAQAHPPGPDPELLPPLVPGQMRLFELPRDLIRFTRDRTVPLPQWAGAIPHLARAWHTAGLLADTHGWSDNLLHGVRLTLVTALSCRAPDELVAYSELLPLAVLQCPVDRTARVLAETGQLNDDRPDKIEQGWIRRMNGVAPAIFDQAGAWLRHLRDGDDRARPRARETVSGYSRVTAPILLRWSQTYDDLREITADEVRRTLATLSPGSIRGALIALRSLFSYLRRTMRIFHDPTSRLKPGRGARTGLVPLKDAHYQEAVAAASTPVHQIALALAAVHAATPTQIQHLHLDHFDIAGRHIVINGIRRYLDDLTHQALVSYLRERRARWPSTANPHLIISHRTAFDDRPVSTYTINLLFQGLRATLGKIRRDRQLEEALTYGPDPLHLSAVFGLSDSTAVHYANSARQLLETAAEQHTAAVQATEPITEPTEPAPG